MRTYYQIIACCLIAIQLHAQDTPTPDISQQKRTEWMTLKTADQTPAAQFATNKTALYLQPEDDLTLLAALDDAIGYRHYRYQQTYKGVPIEGAIYLMHEKNNRVKHANGKLVHQLKLPTNPTINEAAALQTALAQINAELYAWDDFAHEQSIKQVKNRLDATFYPSGELVIINPDYHLKNAHRNTANYRLAYKFDIYAVEPLTRQILYVDAQSGTVLTSVEQIHDCADTGSSGTTNYSGNRNFTACQSGGTYTLKNGIAGNMQVFNANNTAGNPQIPFTDADGFFEGDPTAAEVHWATEKTYEYFLNVHNRNSLNDNGMGLYSWIHYKVNYNNAFWNGSWMTYGDGDNHTFSSLTAPDVVGHEMAHGITQFSAGLQYRYESGALNESFSDIFGEIIEMYSRGTSDWIMGADFTVKTGKNGLRNMSNPNDPNMLTRQPDTYLGDYWYSGHGDHGGVHYNSGVQNYWFYLLSQGGSGTNDNNNTYNISGIGMDKAAAIAYRNLTVYLTASSQYADARTGAIQAAVDLYGADSYEVQQTAAAWCAVGIGTDCLPQNVGCRQNDSLALVALYNATNGANWTNTWNLNEPMDTWHGINLNQNGCVVCLNLNGHTNCTSYSTAGNNLVGTIPPEIGDLYYLNHLDLSQNELLGGSIPPEIGNLINLRDINFSNNTSLTGGIPATLGNLNNLMNLNFYNCGLGGTIPPELGNLSNLKSLNLERDSLDGDIPPELGNLSNVVSLNLKINNLTGTIPPEFGNLDNLARLYLGGNQLTGSIPVEITYLDNLEYLYLRDNQLSGVIPPEIQDLNALTQLDLHSNQLTGNIPQEIGNLNNLEYLTLGQNQFNGTIPPELGNLSNLRTLNFYDGQLTGNIPPELGNLSNLGTLILRFNDLTGSIPPELGNLINLKNLYLDDNQLTGSIPSEIGNLINLSYFRVDHNQFSACYPPNLTILCTQLADGQSVNGFISDGNNFDAEWEDFCETGAGTCLSDPNCRYEDSLSLVALYNATAGANWTIPWNLNQAMDTWHGVTLSGEGCVICLDLDGSAVCGAYSAAGNNLVGTIPPELGELDYLTNLNLSFNQLSGTIPTELANLTNLIELNLSNNPLTGNIPTELSELNNLQVLELYHCDLSGNIPPELSDLVWLTHMDLDSNNLTGTIPPELSQLHFLKVLDLSYNQLTSNIPPELGDLNNLEYLFLSNNQLSGNIPPELGNMSSLVSLYLSTNQLSAGIPSELGNLTNVENITLHANPLTGNIPSELGNLDSLRLLRLSSNQLTGSIPASFGNLSKLEYLSLNYNSLTGNIPLELGNLNNLHTLYLNSNQLSGNIPLELTHINNLVELRLGYNQLSGCYDPALSGLCAYSYPNEWISDGNNFDADWEDFCNTGAGGCDMCRYSDSLALVALYNSTNGANWDNTWNLNQPIDTWYGVTLNEYGCVICLDTDGTPDCYTAYDGIGNNLVGPLPPELGNLEHLEYLQMSINDLNGSLPAELGNLINLRTIRMNVSNLSGSIPPEIGNLSNLRTLDLKGNQLSGSLPSELGNLTNLVEVGLSNNNLTGSIPPELGNLNKVTHLILSNNQLSGNIPPEIGNLSALKLFYISSNQLSGNIPPEFANLSNLGSLFLSNNQLTGSIPPEFGDMNLVHLRLHSNQLSGCYDGNLINLCSRLNNGINAYMSTGNNFDAPWEDFCLNGAGGCSPVEVSPVWPGDFNNDGIANIHDLLYWGVAVNYTGAMRPGATFDWSAQDCPDWSSYVNGVNSKHQDGDGNGIVDNNDLNALLQNFNNTHDFAPLTYNVGAVQYSLELVNSVPDGEVVANTYNLHVESLSDVPVSAHGLACTIDFGDLSVINTTLDTSNSSLAPDEYLDVFDASQNRLDIALSRTDKNNQLLDTPVASFIVMVDNVTTGEEFAIVTSGSMMSANGSMTTISSATFYGSFTGGSTVTSNLSVNVSAVHEGCNTLGIATAEAVGGAAPYTYAWSTSENTAQVSDLVSGSYTVVVTDANGLSTTVSIQINGQAPIYDANGNLLCGSICPDYLTLNGVTPEGTYNASIRLESRAVVPEGDTVNYTAEQTMKFDKGFTVLPGANFSAEIDNCN